MATFDVRRRLEASAALVAAAGVLCLGTPRAAAVEPRRVELAVAAESEIFLRVVGQTADLPLTAVAVGATWIAADALRAWVETPGAGEPTVVVVADPVSGRTLRREVVDTTAGGLAESACAEAIALVVRSGLVELLTPVPNPEVEAPRESVQPRQHPREQVSTSDVRVRESAAPERDTTPDAAPRDVVDAASESAVDRAPEPGEPATDSVSQSQRFGASVRIGMQAVFDGAVPPPEVAPELGLGVRLGAFGLGIVGGYGFALESRDDASVVALRRHHATLELSYAFDATSDAGVAVALRGGLYALDRSTRIRNADYRATEDRTTTSALVGARARLCVPLAGGPTAAHGLSLLFEAGVDFVPGAPTLAYEQSGLAVERDRFWLVEPALSLGLEYIRRP